MLFGTRYGANYFFINFILEYNALKVQGEECANVGERRQGAVGMRPRRYTLRYRVDSGTHFRWRMVTGEHISDVDLLRHAHSPHFVVSG